MAVARYMETEAIGPVRARYYAQAQGRDSREIAQVQGRPEAHPRLTHKLGIDPGETLHAG
jgi:hypothetical protein